MQYFYSLHWDEYSGEHFFCISGTSYRNESIRGAFGDALKEMDASVGVLIDHLTEIGELNNTMVIFTSDNG